MDVRVYVDVKLGDGMDGGALLRGILQGLGATVYQRWSATARATHLVWKNGDGRTLEEARARGVAIVGLAWVNASQDAGGFVPAAPYALPLADRSRAREYLVRRELRTTARKRHRSPHPNTRALRPGDHFSDATLESALKALESDPATHFVRRPPPLKPPPIGSADGAKATYVDPRPRYLIRPREAFAQKLGTGAKRGYAWKASVAIAAIDAISACRA